MNRRPFLSALALLPIVGCASPSKSSGCLPIGKTAENFPLTIDVHAHIFNGSDLQVREFFSQTVINDEPKSSELYKVGQVFSGILQNLAWNIAPSAQQELRRLDSYPCGQAAAAAEAQETANGDYKRGRDQLQSAVRQNRVVLRSSGVLGGGVTSGPELEAAIEGLPAERGAFDQIHASGANVLSSNPTLKGYLDFVLHNFNHRHVNARSYFDTYGKNASRSVDLLVPSLVDYDFFLAKGVSATSPLGDQVKVLSRICVLTRGRVHGFVAFCPFREAVTSSGSDDGASMRLVKDAILNQGLLGVKLYPPMGFAAWGNAELNVWQGKPTLLPTASQADFGKRLDRSMQKLYEFCMANDVPIMAHSNESNGPYKDFRKLANGEHWQRALDRFPGLRISFGHFGDTDLEQHEDQVRTRSFMALMATQAGRNVYADSGYFAGIVGDPVAMEDALKVLLQQPDSPMGQRFMYGTDWMMTLAEKGVGQYLDQFVAIYARIEADLKVAPGTLSHAFFGKHAVQFLGLHKGAQSRGRIDAFYNRHGVDTPDWMRKVDAST